MTAHEDPRTTAADDLDWHLGRRRTLLSATLTVVAGAMTVAAMVPLLSVLGMLVYRGGQRLTPQLFTELPPAAGMDGGGIGNAVVGTLLMVGIAAALSVPFGVLGAVFLAEFGPDSRLAGAVRFVAKVLSGLPSVLAGLFAYAAVVVVTGTYSALAGGAALAVLMVPMVLLTAEQAEELDLDMLDGRDHAHIGYQKINKSTGEVVPQSEIVKGFEVSDGKYVVLTPDDLKSANPKATQSVDIVAFVSRDEIPLLFYAKPYYVSPLKGSDKAYGLLRDALAASRQVGLAQIVIHTRQHMAVVYPHEGSIVVQLLRYAHELKEPDDAGVKNVPHAAKGSRAPEFTMAQQLIDSMVA